MSSASSSDLETNITQKITQKQKQKTSKKKAKPAAVAVSQTDDHGKNEGDNPHWAYEPPKGAIRLDHTIDVGPFEWDTIKDDEDIELWLIRVPDSIKPKYLDGLEIDSPSSSRTARVGGLTKKHTSYDVWSIGDDDDRGSGGKQGKLYIGNGHRDGLAISRSRVRPAPKQVSRHMVISAQPSIATVPEHQPVIYQDPPRASYPKDVLKHAFVPYGARSEQTGSLDLLMDVDGDIEVTLEKSADMVPTPKEKSVKRKESKGKKHKVDGESPKRSKKHKANT
ncbi:hypothetical protein JVU11DRAFT_122 [Chiua virens]|nr:hypothetical protein JVU11DRAFT_122 [Chiua virens]